MKRSMTVFIVLAVLAAGGAAWAADTNTLTVTASVTGTCRFNSATSTLDFGALDPANPVLVNGVATTQFWCTRGVTTTFAALNGAHWSGTSRQMVGPSATDLIPYSLTLTTDGLTNAGPGTLRTLTIDGSILAANYTGATTGSYTDTVRLDITP